MKRILIVDDEDLIRHALSAALRQDDTYVKAVSCGSEALSEIEHIHYDLCFLDVNLPDMNGLDLMMAIKIVSPAMKIIIMTGSVIDAPEQMQAIQTHASLFFPKPFDLDRIKLSVDRIIGQVSSLCRTGVHSYGRSGHETSENRLMGDKRDDEFISSEKNN